MDVPLPDPAVTAMLFGKLPAHGDFVCRGLDADGQGALDEWLSAEMASARSAFGAEFESRYDQAPPWRFAMEDELGWISGALAPSADAVGRRFPVIVGRVAESAVAAAGVAAACETVLVTGLLQGWSADELAGRLAEEPSEAAESAAEPGWWLAGHDGAVERQLQGERPSGLIAAMLGRPGDGS